jgi:hypothetical protein
MKRNFKTVMYVLIAMFIMASCGGKEIDRSKYKSVKLTDAGLGTIIGSQDPNANEVKYFKSTVKYRDFSDDIKKAVGGRKDEFAFATNDSSEVTSFFKIKCRKPALKDGQVVTIYFRVERKNGRVEKTEIDIIE